MNLDAVHTESLKSEFTYIAWKAKTKIHCGKPQLAWEAYLSLDASSKSYILLQMIANVAYQAHTHKLSPSNTHTQANTHTHTHTHTHTETLSL